MMSLWSMGNAEALFCTAVAAMLAALWLIYVLCANMSCRLPPSPGIGLPVLGHMHLLGALPHQSLGVLAHRLGPIIYLRLGSCPTVVITSPTLAKQFLHDHDESFAYRPAMEFADLVFYNSQGSALMQPDDPRWKAIRKLYVQEVLSAKSVLSYKHIRDEEINLLLQELRIKAAALEAIEIRSIANHWILNVMTRLLFSVRASEGQLSEFLDVFRVLSELFAQPILGDFVPYLRWLDPGRLRKRVKLQAKRMDALLEHIVRQRLQHLTSHKAAPADVLTVLLDFFTSSDSLMNIDGVKATVLEILTGSIDTTTAAVEWAMAELLCAPLTMQKLQKKIDAIVEPGQQVEESHFNSLPYLQAVVKETLRLHPPAPLLLPHLAKEPIEIAGFALPRNTRLFVNVWAIGRDESLWEAANEFKPERFLVGGHASQVVLLGGQSYQMLMPFGHGRRGCPGSHLGLTMISLLVANLVHSFHWHSSISSIPTDEVMGISNMLAKPFVATPMVRSMSTSDF